MPKAYEYTAAEMGINNIPDGRLRLDGFDLTSDPTQADVFVVPVMLHWLVGKWVDRYRGTIERVLSLPYLRGNEQGHVLFNVGDTCRTFVHLPVIIFRCDTTQEVMAHDPTTIPIAWPVRDHRECMPLPDGGFKYDVSFVGWVPNDMTSRAVESCRRAGLTCDLELHNWFYGYREKQDIEQDGGKQMRRYKDSLSASRISLCPRSIEYGVLRYRFLEALSAARVPCLIGDGSVLPFCQEECEAWGQCHVQVMESDVDRTGELLKEWLAESSDERIVERGMIGRDLWERRLNADNWPKMMGNEVKSRLQATLQKC